MYKLVLVGFPTISVTEHEASIITRNKGKNMLKHRIKKKVEWESNWKILLQATQYLPQLGTRTQSGCLEDVTRWRNEMKFVSWRSPR